MSDPLAAYEKHMSTCSDADVAAMASVPVNTVKAYRRQHGIRVALSPLRDAFGHTPMAQIARQAGVSVAATSAFADREQLPRFDRRRTAPPMVTEGREVRLEVTGADLVLLGGDKPPAETIREVLERDDASSDPWRELMAAVGDRLPLSSPSTFSVRLPASVLEIVEQRRGDATRAEYIDAALRRALVRLPASSVHQAAVTIIQQTESFTARLAATLAQISAAITG